MLYNKVALVLFMGILITIPSVLAMDVMEKEQEEVVGLILK